MLGVVEDDPGGFGVGGVVGGQSVLAAAPSHAIRLPKRLATLAG
jgi:hypothetical protein